MIHDNKPSLDELMHYGVMGMKWGVRKEYEASPRKPKSKHRVKLETKYQSKGMTSAEAERAAAKRIKVEKIVAVTAVLTLTAAAVYIHQRNVKEYTKQLLTSLDNNGIKSVSDLMKTNKFTSLDLGTDIDMVNPRFGKHNLGYKTNCSNCTVAYEMRRRGYDVEALPLRGGRAITEWQEMFKKAEIITLAPNERVLGGGLLERAQREVTRWGDGARGAVLVSFPFKNLGHVFSVEMHNGRPFFIDPQSGNVNAHSFIEMASNVQLFRTDNLELADTVLSAIKMRGG